METDEGSKELHDCVASLKRVFDQGVAIAEQIYAANPGPTEVMGSELLAVRGLWHDYLVLLQTHLTGHPEDIPFLESALLRNGLLPGSLMTGIPERLLGPPVIWQPWENIKDQKEGDTLLIRRLRTNAPPTYGVEDWFRPECLKHQSYQRELCQGHADADLSFAVLHNNIPKTQ